MVLPCDGKFVDNFNVKRLMWKDRDYRCLKPDQSKVKIIFCNKEKNNYLSMFYYVEIMLFILLATFVSYIPFVLQMY